MKTNEAPEKVYLNKNNKTLLDILSVKDTERIEYIRTDAFIEKARKWFEKQNEWRDLNGNRHCDMESFEDFRKYMEGE